MFGWFADGGWVGGVGGRRGAFGIRGLLGCALEGSLGDGGFAGSPSLQFFIEAKLHFPSREFFTGSIDQGSREEDFRRVFEQGKDHGRVEWLKVDEGGSSNGFAGDSPCAPVDCVRGVADLALFFPTATDCGSGEARCGKEGCCGCGDDLVPLSACGGGGGGGVEENFNGLPLVHPFAPEQRVLGSEA